MEGNHHLSESKFVLSENAVRSRIIFHPILLILEGTRSDKKGILFQVSKSRIRGEGTTLSTRSLIMTDGAEHVEAVTCLLFTVQCSDTDRR